MYQISQMFVANYGYRGAFFPNRIIDLRKGDDVVASAMLFAENGGGKTSFLSMMIHLFVPDKKKFVQYLQKKHSHRFEHYFTEGKPCIFMFELVRQRKDMFATKEPALVIGVYAKKLSDGRVEETFFRFNPTSGVTFDDMDAVRLTKEGRPFEWTVADAQQWLKDMRVRSEEKPLVDFRTFDTHGPWRERLADDGFRMSDFETMMTMATREGGLDAFMQSKSADDMLRKLHQLFTDESEHADHINKMQTILDESRDLPFKQSQFRALTVLCEKEEDYVSEAAGLDGLSSAVADLQGKLVYLRRRAGEQRGLIEDVINELTARRPELEEAVAGLDRDERKARNMGEASRITIAAALYNDAARRYADLNTQLLRIGCRKQTYDRVLSNAVERIRLSNTANDLKAEIAASEHENSERLEPVRKAGQKAKQLADRLLADFDGRLAGFAETMEAIAEKRNAAQNRQTTLIGDLRLSRDAGDRVSGLVREVDIIAAEAVPLLAGRPLDELDDVVHDLQKELETAHKEDRRLELVAVGLANDVKNSRSTLASVSDKRHKVEVHLSRLAEASRRYVEKAELLKSSSLQFLTTEPDVDLSDPEVSVQAEDKRNKFRDHAFLLHREMMDIENRLHGLKNVGGFDDPDLKAALSRCQALGISNVRPFVLWLSEQNLEAEEARRIVENNLSVALGLLVDTERDRKTIVESFSRTEWQLQKPVSVTVLDHDLHGRLLEKTAEKNTTLLSSSTDYAYNTASKLAAIHELESALAGRSKAHADFSEHAAKLETLEAELRTLRTILGHRRWGAFQQEAAEKACEADDLRAESARLEDMAEELEARHGESLADLEENKESLDEIGSRLKSISACKFHLDNLRANIDKERNIHDIERDIEEAHTSLARIRGDLADIERMRQQAEADKDVLIASQAVALTKASGIMHFGSTSVDLSASDDFETALASYRRHLEDYEQNVEKSDAIAGRKFKLKEITDDLTRKDLEIITAVRAIALDQKTVEAAVEAELHGWLGLSHQQRDALIAHLRSSEDTCKKSLAELQNQLYIHNTDKACRDSFDPLEIRALCQGLSDNSLAELEELYRTSLLGAAAAAAAHSETKETLRSLKEQANKQNFVYKDLEAIIARLESKRFQQAISVEVPALDFGNLKEISQLVKDLKSQEDIASARFAEAETLVKHKNAVVCRFVSENAKHIGLASLVEQYSRFQQDYKARGTIGGDMLHHVGEVIGSLASDIDGMSRKEGDLLRLVARLYEFARDNILKATRIAIPASAKSQFAGANILRLHDKMTVKAIREINPETVAQRFVENLRSGADAPSIDRMASLSVDLLNIVSQILIQKPFELQILKPVVGAKIQYDTLHKMTGSGGQTITASLLLYLVATNIAGNSSSEQLMGFLILDNPIGAANNTQLVETQLESARDFGIQMISTTGIMDDYLSAYERVIQFSASRVRKGFTEVDIKVEKEEDTAIDLFDFELNSPVGLDEAA
jgi:uncharacterized protein YoxC